MDGRKERKNNNKTELVERGTDTDDGGGGSASIDRSIAAGRLIGLVIRSMMGEGRG